MNSQQELIEAINTISDTKDKAFDTPATVLRVEEDTAWVHIDGGADETPVQKTISCEEGETVQVRISNGSAFLVGNASSPPTDDTTAEAAHFVAEQADVIATEAKEDVVKLEKVVDEECIFAGDSNIKHLSSTMYQNAEGVNIYNDTLAVGDSYAHIDGDSFDIKKATNAGEIDDENDPIVASFGREITIGSRYPNSVIGPYSQVFGYQCEASGDYSHAEGYQTISRGDHSHAEGYGSQILIKNGVVPDGVHVEGFFTTADADYTHAEGCHTEATGYVSHAEGDNSIASGVRSHAQNLGTIAASHAQTAIGMYNEEDNDDVYAFIIGNGDYVDRSDAFRVDWNGNVYIKGEVKDMDGNNKTPTILDSTTIPASATSYTFSDAAIKADSVIDIYDTIFKFNPTNAVTIDGSCTITFPAQSSSHTIRIYVY